MTDPIGPDLKTVMRRLRLGKLIDTLPERVALARQQKMAHQDFLLLLLSDECQRRDSAASTTRAERALLDPDMQIERWDSTAKVTYDRELLNELVSMRFVEAHRHATVIGPVGVGKTFIAHALGHIACRHKYSVLAVRTDKLLKTLKHARLDHSHEAELRKLLAVDVLIIDDFGLDAMDATESRDVHEILTERDRAGSVIITSNRGPDEWLATFADPVRAQAAIDRFTCASCVMSRSRIAVEIDLMDHDSLAAAEMGCPHLHFVAATTGRRCFEETRCPTWGGAPDARLRRPP